MNRTTTPALASIGIGIGKEVFHVVGFEADGKIAFRRKLGTGLDHPAIWACPVPAMSGKGPDPAPINRDQGAVAVVLDLVNPVRRRRAVPAQASGFPA